MPRTRRQAVRLAAAAWSAGVAEERMIIRETKYQSHAQGVGEQQPAARLLKSQVRQSRLPIPVLGGVMGDRGGQLICDRAGGDHGLDVIGGGLGGGQVPGWGWRACAAAVIAEAT